MAQINQIVFLVLSAIAICGALAVIFSRNAMYSVLFLVLTFFTIAGHFVLLNAQFSLATHLKSVRESLQ